MKNIPEHPTKINTSDPYDPYEIWTDGKLLRKIDNSKNRLSLAGGVYKPKGRHTWRVWFPWRGKKIFINHYLDGTPLYHEAQAVRVLEKIRAEADQGVFDPGLWAKDRSLIFQNAWMIYMEQCPCGTSRSDTRDRIYNTFILPYFKDKSLKEIEDIHIRDWWSGIPKTYNPNYLRMIRDVLKGFLNFHKVTRKKMLEYPTLKIPRKTPEWLSKAEQEKILSFMPIHYHTIFKFLFFYGCRIGEACNLKRTDIDWEKNIIMFRERKNDRDNALPLSEEIKTIINTQKLTNWEYVFCNRKGLPYTRQALYFQWRLACRKAGVKVIPLKNGTRHSKACQLLEQGESSFVVARVLGNTPRVVEHAYGNISIKKVEEVLCATIVQQK